MKVHYLYQITRDDGAFYIGRHSTKSLQNSYLGSGTDIRKSVAKYGKQAHKKEILQIVETFEELVELEKTIVDIELLLDPLCLNKTLGGLGSFNISKEQNSKTSRENWQRPEYREPLLAKMRDGRLKHAADRVYNTAALSKNSVANWKNPEYRMKLEGFGKYERSDSTKQKMRELQSARTGEKATCFGKIWITDGTITKKILPTEFENFQKLGFKRGRK